MKLIDFVEKYVAPNSIVRLWVKDEIFKYRGVYAIEDEEGILLNAPIMEWEIKDPNHWSYIYKDCLVNCVASIFCELYGESINIVLEQ